MTKSVARVSSGLWAGRRVLVTGHTGFKGAWLTLWLSRMGAHVVGVSLPPSTPSLFEAAGIRTLCDSRFIDITDGRAVRSVVEETQPEVVLHLAAQALVRASYREPVATFAANVQGTVHVLDAARRCEAVRAVVAITTDKVYRNLEEGFPFRETDALGGHDPYSASKAAAEMVIESYRKAYFAPRGVALASARAGNVIGGGDWAEDRLLPDAIRAWSREEVLEVRRPSATRPWQHVLEALSAYLCLAQALLASPERASSFNFGPHSHEAATVRQVIELAQASFGAGRVAWGDGSEGPHEAGRLLLDVTRARDLLGVQPRWTLAEAVGRTASWYRRALAGESARELCLTDIEAFDAAIG